MPFNITEPIAPANVGDNDSGPAVLAWAQQILTETAGETTLPTLLQGLATAFAAPVAGIGSPLPGPIRVQHWGWAKDQAAWELHLPWEDRPEILQQLLETPTALVVDSDDGTTWLLCSVWFMQPFGWLLVVGGDKNRAWSQGEKAALVFAGQALARRMVPGNSAIECAQKQCHLENAAVLTGRLVHDFGNLLTGILGFSELCLKQLANDSPGYRYLKEVCQAAQNGAKWIHKLQLFSRRSQPVFWPTTLTTVVTREEARVRASWGRDIAFLLAFPADLPAVAIDAESLQLILGPLLDNAREAITGQGVVTLSARTVELSDSDVQDILGKMLAGPYVEITVTDTGAGFAPQTRRRLFTEMFFSTKKRQCGLGLPVVYGVLQTFGGGLRFGPDPEQGTAVSIYLPLADIAEPAWRVAKPATPSANLRGRILVVDDDRLILEFVSKVLEQAGYVVKTAPGPLEALSLYAKPSETFQLVVTDVVMPTMNGFDMARRMKKHNPRVNLIFISSFLANIGKEQDEFIKEFTLLRKPFEPAELVQAVKNSLARNGRS